MHFGCVIAQGSKRSEVDWIIQFDVAGRCDIGITTIYNSNYYHKYLCTPNIRPNRLKIETISFQISLIEVYLLTGRSFWCTNLGHESSYHTMRNELSFWGLIVKSCWLMSLAILSAFWMCYSTRQQKKWSWLNNTVWCCRKVRYRYYYYLQL